MPSEPTTARIDARVSSKLHAMVKRAAEIRGQSMTDFVVSALQDAAERAIEQSGFIQLSLADQERFTKALIAPPKVAPALKRALAHRHKLLGSN